MIARLHDIALLRAPARAAHGSALAGMRLREARNGDMADIVAGHLAHGRRVPQQRIERRFSHGLRFFQLWQGTTLAASTWILQGGSRYIDEVGLAFPIAADEIWIRDVFVAPDLRGKRLYSHLLCAILSELDPQCSTLWSDVDLNNTASMHAHHAYGFRIQMRLRALDIGRWLRLRQLPPSWPLPLQALEPTRRLIVWREPLRARHRALIA